MLILGCAFLFLGGYWTGNIHNGVVHARTPMHGFVPKSYGRLVTAIADSIGVGVIFEDEQGTIRFVSITGMKEGELPRY